MLRCAARQYCRQSPSVGPRITSWGAGGDGSINRYVVLRRAARPNTHLPHAVSMGCTRTIDAAQQHAKRRAEAAGKPKTQVQGLRAIHAVLNRASFARDEDAWNYYETSRQRYYEWKAQLNGGQPLLRDALCPAKRCREWVDMSVSASHQCGV